MLPDTDTQQRPAYHSVTSAWEGPNSSSEQLTYLDRSGLWRLSLPLQVLGNVALYVYKSIKVLSVVPGHNLG